MITDVKIQSPQELNILLVLRLCMRLAMMTFQGISLVLDLFTALIRCVILQQLEQPGLSYLRLHAILMYKNNLPNTISVQHTPIVSIQ